MKIAIVGGRDFEDYKLLKTYVNNAGLKITHIVSGGARGADSLGKKFAQEHGYKMIEFLPDWDKHKKAAGYIRNQQIIESADWVFAFWDNMSKGTKHSIDISRRLRKPLEIITYHK